DVCSSDLAGSGAIHSTCTCELPKARRETIAPDPGTTSMNSAVSRQGAAPPPGRAHSPSPFPPKSTTASAGGSAGRSAGAGCTTGGAGRSSECTGHFATCAPAGTAETDAATTASDPPSITVLKRFISTPLASYLPACATSLFPPASPGSRPAPTSWRGWWRSGTTTATALSRHQPRSPARSSSAAAGSRGHGRSATAATGAEFPPRRACLLADAEAQEDPVQHVLDIHHAQQLVQRERREPHVMRSQHHVALPGEMRPCPLQLRPRPQQRIPVPLAGERRLEVRQLDPRAEDGVRHPPAQEVQPLAGEGGNRRSTRERLLAEIRLGAHDERSRPQQLRIFRNGVTGFH